MSEKRLTEVNVSPDGEIELVFSVAVSETIPIYQIGHEEPVGWEFVVRHEKDRQVFTNSHDAQAAIDACATPRWHPQSGDLK